MGRNGNFCPENTNSSLKTDKQIRCGRSPQRICFEKEKDPEFISALFSFCL